jgi:hypothetical protein
MHRECQTGWDGSAGRARKIKFRASIPGPHPAADGIRRAARVDTSDPRLHSRAVGMLRRRIAVSALAVVLSAGDAGVCAGWEATAEARMACCVEGSCPMHNAETGLHSAEILSQAQADSCCASSESTNPTPASPVFAMALPPVTVVQQFFTARPGVSCAFDAARDAVTVAIRRVPKHVFLSVFLI